MNGRTTGFGLVFLESEKQFEEAITKLNKLKIGDRYIDLLPVKLRY